MNPVFCENMEVTRNTRVPHGRPSRTTSGTRTTGWEPLCYTLLSFEGHIITPVAENINLTSTSYLAFLCCKHA